MGFRQPLFGSWHEPPQPALTLMIGFEGSLRADGERLPDAWVGGLSDTRSMVELDDGYESLDLKLTPAGAYRIFGYPPGELGGAVAGLEDVLGADGRRLAEELGENVGWEARFDVIERFLIDRAVDGSELTPAVQLAWDRLRASGGRVRIGELAREMGCSRRYLAVMFREQIGLPPKSVARLVRFQRTCRRIESAPARWADIAVDAGYYDQSHLNRDFRELAGTTPTDFVARHYIPFVQD